MPDGSTSTIPSKSQQLDLVQRALLAMAAAERQCRVLVACVNVNGETELNASDAGYAVADILTALGKAADCIAEADGDIWQTRRRVDFQNRIWQAISIAEVLHKALGDGTYPGSKALWSTCSPTRDVLLLIGSKVEAARRAIAGAAPPQVRRK